MPLKIGVHNCELGTNPSTPNDNPESVISVFMVDIYPVLVIIGPHERFWFPCTSHIHLLLAVFGFYVYCLFVYSKLNAHAPSLLLRFWWMSSATYRPGIWSTVLSVVFSGSAWMQIFLKRCRGRRRKKKIIFVRVGGPWAHSPPLLVKKKHQKKKPAAAVIFPLLGAFRGNTGLLLLVQEEKKHSSHM